MAADAVPGPTKAGPLKENDENNKLFPLNEQALIAFLKAVSDAAVTGITILNVYSAICITSWAENPVNTVLKAAMMGLPFSVLPILLITRSIMKLLDQGGCSLDMGATLVLFEFIYIYVLGGVTTTVLFEVSKVTVASVIVVLICIVIKLWGRLSNHPKYLMVINFDRVDLENSVMKVSSQTVNKTKVAARKLEMAPKHLMSANSIKISLNIFFVLYLVFYVGFMLVLGTVAEKWWHALLGISVMSLIHMSGLYLTSYLRDGLVKVQTAGLPCNEDIGCKLLVSEKM